MTTELIIEQWKQVITTQMHFNDMLMQLRAIGISVIMASYGGAAIAFVQYKNTFVCISGKRIRPSTMVILFTMLIILALFALDYCYYFQMLLTAVEVGNQMELNPAILFDLTRQISSDISPSSAKYILMFLYGAPFLVGIILLVSQQFATIESSV